MTPVAPRTLNDVSYVMRTKYARLSAVTVRQFEISSRALRRLKVLLGPLLRYWKMDLSLAGVTNCMAATARQFKISSKVCRTFKSQVRALLPFGKMDLSFAGVIASDHTQTISLTHIVCMCVLQ